MEVNVKQALKMFFSKSSFEMIYFEAFANALDADATEFHIDITLSNYGEWQNLVLTLKDNGVGFDDIRFGKFGKLFDVEEQSHKGLGRLVYLCYFDQVHVESIYSKSKRRIFDFNESFDKKCKIDNIGATDNGSIFTMTGFTGMKLAKNDYINPGYIKKALLENFYMKFYKAKLAKKQINVYIRSVIGGTITEATINTTEMPNFNVKPLEIRADLFNRIDLYYYVKEVEPKNSKVITALAVDDRSHKVDIIAHENLPSGYEMIFLLISESFQSSIDGARLNLTISELEQNRIKTIFRTAIADVIKEQFPKIEKGNKEKVAYLNKTFPHLSGYFESNDIGYSSQSDVLKKAQDKFFRDQKEILGAKDLNDEQFEKSLDLSARALVEYILFRQNVIKKMRKLNGKNKEEDLHNLIAPRFSEFQNQDIVTDLYRNNVWVLDDKFMTYCTVLSEVEMSKVIAVITKNEVKDNDNDRPDITLFFSDNPNKEGMMVDVVVVELKRLGISAEQNSIVEFQLDTRTQRLAEYYGNRIQRMWFYGIVDFDERYKMHLVNNGFNPLFSNGNIYFRSKPVYLDLSKQQSVIQNAYILDFSAIVEDADSRNSTFLKILQNKFEKRDS
ncbi:ATP-binding protein [Bacteroides thetaiotaomicron]|uniref:ATP-binding protein n=1 Tax=Bacteroides thetaiotaomicron TaxID=818 RepID=UPI0021658D5B|nr:ATP-binding protein [Bacteroides thetaiotaomicron]MCS2872492.1 ATP-binding protein [Bacteroides thetaiotaomicron]